MNQCRDVHAFVYEQERAGDLQVFRDGLTERPFRYFVGDSFLELTVDHARGQLSDLTDLTVRTNVELQDQASGQRGTLADLLAVQISDSGQLRLDARRDSAWINSVPLRIPYDETEIASEEHHIA